MPASKSDVSLPPVIVDFEIDEAISRAKKAMRYGMRQDGYTMRDMYHCIERRTYNAALTALCEASDAIVILKELGVIREAKRERAFDPPTCP